MTGTRGAGGTDDAEGVSRGRPLAVFDLDGTLSDTRHRLHYVEAQPKRWNAFFDQARHDAPLTEGVELALRWSGECDLAYVTGRPERCRQDTLAWLREQGLPIGALWMRADQDRRPARVAKLQLLRRLARERAVEVVVDDDVRVCQAYESAGFAVVRADWMASAPLLDQAQEEGHT